MSNHDRNNNRKRNNEAGAEVVEQVTNPATTDNQPETAAEVIAGAVEQSELTPLQKLSAKLEGNRFAPHFPLDGVRFEFIEKPSAGLPYGEGKQMNTVPVRMADVFVAMGDTEAAIPCVIMLQQGPDKEGRCRLVVEKKGQKVILKGEDPTFNQAEGKNNRAFKIQWPSKGRMPYITPFVKIAKGSAAAEDWNTYGAVVVELFKLRLAERHAAGLTNPINWNVQTVMQADTAPGTVGVNENEGENLGID